MENKQKTPEQALQEAAALRAAAQKRIESLKMFWRIFGLTGVILLAVIALLVRLGLGWFASNRQVTGTMGAINAAFREDFSLATLGSQERGKYDSLFGLSHILKTEMIGETTYYLSNGRSSLRLDSDKNLNNYFAGADLRPGNGGSFDLYVICRTDRRALTMQPVFSAWYGVESDTDVFMDAFSQEAGSDVNTAAEFLKGHILLFANMDDRGMYSGNIDLTKKIAVDLSACKASQDGKTFFSWGESVFRDENKEVFRLPVYWVWPEQFGNFIYTGNSYNKNLFSSKDSDDYRHFVRDMQSDTEYQKYFSVGEGEERPSISAITAPETDYKLATQYYELYSGWYNLADEKIGDRISYIELGFEIEAAS